MRTFFRPLLRGLQVLVLAAVSILGASAQAATFTVTNNSDADTLDTVCDIAGTGDGCALREAIAAANADPSTSDTVVFAANVRGTIDLTRIGDSVLGSSAFALTGPIEIVGPGANVLNVRRSGGGDYRIFRVARAARARISGLTISNGNLVSFSDGGGIVNDGALTLVACAISGNTAAGFDGGVSNIGSLLVQKCTISGNTSNYPGGNTSGGIGSGGPDATLDISNSTFSNNSAPNGDWNAAAIWSDKGAATITNCTLTGNSARGKGSASGLFAVDGDTHISNTIIAGNESNGLYPDVVALRGAFSSSGFNLIGNAGNAADFSAPGDQKGTASARLDPKLGPLALNGGPTLTHALLRGSLALDAADPVTASGTDQRGLPRVVRLRADIGAFEEQNRQPQAHDSARAIDEDTSLVLSARAQSDFGYSDPENDPLARLQITRLPEHGTLSLAGTPVTLHQQIDADAPGSLVYTPNANFFGSDSIGFNVADDFGFGAASASLNIAISAVNDAPSFSIASNPPSVDEDAGPQVLAGFVTNISPGAGESAQSLSFSIASNSNPSLFSSPPVVSADGTLSYTSAPNASGTAQISVTLSDGGSNEAPNRNASAPQSFAITIAARDDAPVLANIESSALTFVENGAATPISAAITASDMDSGTLSGATISIVSGYASGQDALAFAPQNNISGSFNAATGVLTLSGSASPAQYQAALRSVTFRNSSENPSSSARTIEFVLRDNTSSSNALSRNVLVKSVNDAPVAQSASLQTNEDTPLSIALGVSDADSSNLSFEIISGPANGTLSGSGQARTHTPRQDFVGSDSFSFRVSDGAANSNTAVVTVTVRAQNDAPSARDDAASTVAGASLSVQVLANDADVDGDSLRVSAIDIGGARGTASISADGKSVLFVPESGFSGETSFGYTAWDGIASSNARVTVTVAAAPASPITPEMGNRAPVAVADSYSTRGRLQVLVAQGVLRNDRDADGDALTASLKSVPGHGTLSFEADGSFSYTPAVGFRGSDSFAYAASDGKSQSAIVKVNLLVAPTRDVTPPALALAGSGRPAERRLAPLRGTAADVSVRQGVPVVSSGLKSVSVLLQRPDGGYWNGRAYQKTPFNLPLQQLARSFFAISPSLMPPLALASDGRYKWTATAIDNAGNITRATQFVLVDSSVPSVMISTPRAGADGTARISRLSAVSGRVSEASTVKLLLRRGDGQYWNGRAFQKARAFQSVRSSGGAWSFAAASLFQKTSLPVGRYSLEVRAEDAAGNEGAATRTLLVESAPSG